MTSRAVPRAGRRPPRWPISHATRCCLTAEVTRGYSGLLAEHAGDLGEPYTRHLGGNVREWRSPLLREQTRVTYWLAPQRRVILLTVFRQTAAGGVVPTIPRLERISAALDADLIVALAPHAA